MTNKFLSLSKLPLIEKIKRVILKSKIEFRATPNARQLAAPLNRRFMKELPETDEDVARFAEYMKTAEMLGVYHARFNVINCDTLRDAIERTENSHW